MCLFFKRVEGMEGMERVKGKTPGYSLQKEKKNTLHYPPHHRNPPLLISTETSISCSILLPQGYPISFGRNGETKLRGVQLTERMTNRCRCWPGT